MSNQSKLYANISIYGKLLFLGKIQIMTSSTILPLTKDLNLHNITVICNKSFAVTECRL